MTYGNISFNGWLNRGSPRARATRGENSRVFQQLLPTPCNFLPNLLGILGKVLAGIFLGVLLFSGVCRAEDGGKATKVPDFVPFVIDQQQYRAALEYLGGLKFNDAAPVVKWMNDLEDRAKRDQLDADHKADGAK